MELDRKEAFDFDKAVSDMKKLEKIKLAYKTSHKFPYDLKELQNTIGKVLEGEK